MRSLLIISAACLCIGAPVAAGQNDPVPEYLDRIEKFSRHTQKFLQQFAEQMGPQLEDLIGKIGDWSRYEMPEVLANGDIIIRRKKPEKPKKPEKDAPDDGSIDL